MVELAKIIEEEIKKQYKSVRQFSKVSDIPQTTIVSAIKNGVSGTAYETVIKICKLLNIELINYDTHLVMTDDVIDMIKMFNALDEVGHHAVMAFMSMEFNRVNASIDYIQKAINESNAISEKKLNDMQNITIVDR